MRLLPILGCVAGVAAAQTYTVTALLPPPGVGFFNLDGSMNNKGQVLGEVGNLSAGLRYPVVWTNGVAQALPIPSGYSYIANLSTYKINDSGTVIGTVENAGTQRTHIAVWKDGIPTVLPDPPIS